MARGRRMGPKGPSLLIPMVVLIVAWLGLTYYAYDLANRNKELFDRYHEARYNMRVYEVQQNFNNVEHEQLSKYIGFRGNAPKSYSRTLKDLIAQYKTVEYVYYTVPDANRYLDQPIAKIEKPAPRGPIPDGFERGLRQSEFTFENANDLEAIIKSQDEFINKVLDANRTLQQAIITTFVATTEQHVKEVNDTNKAIADRDRNIVQQREALKAQLGDSDTADKDFQEKQKEFVAFYDGLMRGDDLIERITSLKKARRESELAQRTAREEADFATMATYIAERPTSERDHFDGTIYYVDLNNRWAYINLGAKDGAKTDMTFTVVRYQLAEQPLQIGIVQIKQVQSERTSWCDIITTLDPGVQMQAGDKIIDPGFFRTPHPKRYALVGDFGGAFSAYDERTTAFMISKAGFIVDPEVTRETQVVILGVNYREDPQFKAIMEEGGAFFAGRTSYQFWRADELYYFLGKLK